MSVQPHSWEPIDLVALGDAPPLEPTICGLSYPGALVLIYGEPETVKTWLALAISLDQIRLGKHVLWIDFEMSAPLVRGRLRDLGATDDELGRFKYLCPSEPIGVVEDAVAALVEKYDPSVCTIDAMAGALAVHQLSGLKAEDIERFYGTVVRVLRSKGAAVHVLDHVVKDRETRGRWPIESQRKLGGADVGLSMEMLQDFGRGLTGRARIRVTKDRHGSLARPYVAELELNSDAETGRITWELKPASATETYDRASGGRHRTWYLDEVRNHLALQTEPVTCNSVVKAIGHNRQYVLQAIDILIEDKEITPLEGPRGAKLLSLSPTGSLVPEPVGNQNQWGTGSPVPPSNGNQSQNQSPEPVAEVA